MAEPDYAAALEVATGYQTQLVEGLAVDLVEAQSSRHRVQEIVEDDAHKLWQAQKVVCKLGEKKSKQALAELQQRARLAPQPEFTAPPKPQSDLRAATIMCLPDRISDSVNQWLTNHPYADVVSIQFGQFERAFGAIVLYRLRLAGQSDRSTDQEH